MALRSVITAVARGITGPRSKVSGAGAVRCLNVTTSLLQQAQARGNDALGGTSGEVSCEISSDKRLVQLDGVKSYPICFNATWLRHNCHCPECRHPGTGQWTFEKNVTKALYTLKSAQIKGNEVVFNTKEEDDHTGTIPLEYLRINDYSERGLDEARENATPQLCQGEISGVQFTEFQTTEGLQKLLEILNIYGLVLIHGVPSEDKMVLKVANRISSPQKTIYEDVYDVVSTPDPINIAYTPTGLGLHMDLPYYESPPGLQLLHCLRLDSCVVGGQNRFVDAWFEAEKFRREHPEHFKILSRVPATFQKIHYDRENPVHMTIQKPHFELGTNDQIIALNWAPAHEGPLFVPEEDVEPYYIAYDLWKKQLYSHCESLIDNRMEQGDVVIFNNRRMMHSRKSFQLNGGHRHLQGCYIQIDEFKNRLQLLNRELNIKQPVKRVFNHCSF